MVEQAASASVAEHMAADGESMSARQRIDTQLEHAVHTLQQDLPGLGEVLIQLGGERGVVTGPLSDEDMTHAQSSIKTAAHDVRASRQSTWRLARIVSGWWLMPLHAATCALYMCRGRCPAPSAQALLSCHASDLLSRLSFQHALVSCTVCRRIPR